MEIARIIEKLRLLFFDSKPVLKIGDILGVDFDLPEGLEGYEGWMMSGLTAAKIPQFILPTDKVSVVPNYTLANELACQLADELGGNVRLINEADRVSIFNNIMKGGFNHKAKLDTDGELYWLHVNVKSGCPTAPAANFSDVEEEDWLKFRLKDQRHSLCFIQEIEALAPHVG